MYCSYCGAENVADYVYCHKCGKKRKDIPTPTVSPETQPAENESKKSPSSTGWMVAAVVLGLMLVALLVVAAIMLFPRLNLASLLPKYGATSEKLFILAQDGRDQLSYYQVRPGESLDEVEPLVDRGDGFESYYLEQNLNWLDIFNGDWQTSTFGMYLPEDNGLILTHLDRDTYYLSRVTANNELQPVLDSEVMLVPLAVHNGAVVIYESEDDETNCYLLKPGETEATRVSKAENCLISHEGSWLLASRFNDDESTVRNISLSDGQEVSLLDREPDVDDLGYSHMGALFYYATSDGDENRLFVLDATTGKRIAESDVMIQQPMVYDNGGDAIAYSVQEEDGLIHLYVLQGEAFQPVAAGFSIQADLSGNGQYLIYVVKEDQDEFSAHLYDIANANDQELLTGVDLSVMAFNYRDDYFLLTEIEEDWVSVNSVSYADGKVHPIETFNGFVDVVYQNPTSPFVFFTVSEEGKSALYYSDLKEGEQDYLIEDMAEVKLLNLFSDGRQAIVSAREEDDDDSILYLVPVTERTKITELDEAWDFQNAVPDPAGRYLYFTALENSGKGDTQEISGEVRRIDIKDMDKAEVLYEEAFLGDVSWGGLYGNIHEANRYYPHTTSIPCPLADEMGIAMELQETSLSVTEEGLCMALNVEEPQALVFFVPADPDRPYMELLDAEGTVLARSELIAEGVILLAEPVSAGQYFIRFSSSSPIDFSVIYGAEVPDLDVYTAIPMNIPDEYSSAVTADDYHTISLNGSEYDFYGQLYQFEGRANQSIRIRIIARDYGSSLDSHVYLIDSDFELIADDDDSNDYDSDLVYTLPRAGTYYFIVQSHGGSYGDSSNYYYTVELTEY